MWNKYSLNTRSAGRILIAPLVILLLALTGSQSGHVLASSHELAVSPHLGYGIHVAPWTRVDVNLVNDLGVDWVKIYNPDQATVFTRQKVLYRIEVAGMPGNITTDYADNLRRFTTQLTSLGVDAVEIGNEPNLGAEWGNTPPNAANYVTVLRVAYQAIKSVNPNMIVISGGLAPTGGTADGKNVDDLVFAQQMLSAGAADYFDAFGYHPYGFASPPETDPNSAELVFRRAERMYNLLLANGVRNRPMWMTEYGWLRDPAELGRNCTGQENFNDFAWMTHTAAEQATFTVRSFQFADANWPWAGPMFLWNLDWNVEGNSRFGPCSHLRLFSILNHDGSPLPAYYAFRDMPKRYVPGGPSLTVPGVASALVSAVVDAPLLSNPEESARVNGLTRTMQAGCDGLIRLGSFTVVTRGLPGSNSVSVESVNGPGVPRTWTSSTSAINGSVISVFIDSRNVTPGLYQIAVNLRSTTGQRLATHVVRGWLLVHYPTRSGCASSGLAGR